MAQSGSPSIPIYLDADCLGCENSLGLEAVDADADARVAYYKCQQCDHRAELRLDPE